MNGGHTVGGGMGSNRDHGDLSPPKRVRSRHDSR